MKEFILFVILLVVVSFNAQHLPLLTTNTYYNALYVAGDRHAPRYVRYDPNDIPQYPWRHARANQVQIDTINTKINYATIREHMEQEGDFVTSGHNTLFMQVLRKLNRPTGAQTGPHEDGTKDKNYHTYFIASEKMSDPLANKIRTILQGGRAEIRLADYLAAEYSVVYAGSGTNLRLTDHEHDACLTKDRFMPRQTPPAVAMLHMRERGDGIKICSIYNSEFKPAARYLEYVNLKMRKSGYINQKDVLESEIREYIRQINIRARGEPTQENVISAEEIQVLFNIQTMAFMSQHSYEIFFRKLVDNDQLEGCHHVEWDCFANKVETIAQSPSLDTQQELEIYGATDPALEYCFKNERLFAFPRVPDPVSVPVAFNSIMPLHDANFIYIRPIEAITISKFVKYALKDIGDVIPALAVFVNHLGEVEREQPLYTEFFGNYLTQLRDANFVANIPHKQFGSIVQDLITRFTRLSEMVPTLAPFTYWDAADRDLLHSVVKQQLFNVWALIDHRLTLAAYRNNPAVRVAKTEVNNQKVWRKSGTAQQKEDAAGTLCPTEIANLPKYGFTMSLKQRSY